MTTPLLALLLVATSAAAQTPATTTTTTTEAPAEVRYRTTSVVDMNTVDVVGTVQGPTMWRVHQRKKTAFRSLVELRSDFHAELATSTAGL